MMRCFLPHNEPIMGNVDKWGYNKYVMKNNEQEPGNMAEIMYNGMKMLNINV